MKLTSFPISEASIKLDVEKAKASFEKDSTAFIHYSNIEHGDENLSLFLEGEVSTQGITSKKFDNQEHPTYSLGVKLDDLDRTNFEQLVQSILGGLAAEHELRITTPLKGSNLYLKLKTDDEGKNFNFKSNIKLSPSTIATAPIRRTQRVEADVSFSVYFNFKDKQCGIMLKLGQVDFIKTK